MTTVFLDSNIYRQLGQNFLENQDFKRLKDFLDNTYNEFGLLNVVQRELLDFYQKDIYARINQDYAKIKANIENNSFIKLEDLPDLENEIKNGFNLASKQFEIHKVVLGSREYSSKELLDFLLINKRVNGRKDNTRDFLIAKDLIDFAKNDKKSQVILISDDDFFTSHKHVKSLIEKESLDNLHFYPSISAFLKEFGPQFDFVNEKLVLSSVDIEEIRKELLNDIKCFPGYTSSYYTDKELEEIPEIKELLINELIVHDYYVTKNIKPDTYKIQFSLAVPIKATYEKEKHLEKLLEFRKNPVNKYRKRYPETFDDENRLVFEHKVLFIYEGVVNTTKETLEEVSFIDFFPDHFLWQEEIERIKEERKSEPTPTFCDDGKHIFDENAGFYQRSRYGGGLSWHYRCSKCGMLYDTGDYFD